MRLLIAAGANVNMVDKYGIKPLYIAVEKNDLMATKILEQHGAFCTF